MPGRFPRQYHALLRQAGPLTVGFWVYVVAIHLLVAVIFARPGLITVARAAILGRSAIAEDQRRERDRFIASVRSAHRTIDPFVPAGARLVAGDSIAMGFPADALGPVAVNFGIGYQRTDDLLESMAIYASMAHAAQVVVIIGANNVLQGRVDGIEADYRAILAKVPAGVPVTLMGPPAMAGQRWGLARAASDAADRACAADPRCTFVDAVALLSKGRAPAPGALQADGIHPSAAGYAVLLPLVRAAGR